MTTLTRTLIREIEAAPEPIQREVFDYLAFLKSRQTDRVCEEAAADLRPLASAAWVADWSTPEEDEAWRDL